MYSATSQTRTVSIFTLACCSAAMAFVISACGQGAPSTASQSDEILSTRVHKMPMNASGTIQQNSAPAGAHLTYYGGRINAATKVVQVLWGSGSYLSNVSSTSAPSMATFYNQMLSKTTLNTFLDGEYNTARTGGTSQHFTSGAFQSQVQITPSVTSSTITDTQIQTELTAQIAAGHLPAPAVDAQGNAVTYYAIFFPPGKTISQGGSNSCVSGGFCAYHGTVASSSAHSEYYYGVHPDMQAGSGCATGCGNSTTFGNYTSVASHELVEMMTDAEVGIAGSGLTAPLAWYDGTNGEIGDICNAQQGTIAACDGQSYVIQLEFSNAQSNCIGWSPSCGTGTNDFSIAASPASATVAAGGSTSSTISTATTSGSAQTVSLSVSGAPTGVTASFSPASVSSGQSSTLSVTTTSSAAPGTYALTITGSATSGSHSATFTLTISGGTGGGGSITNGGFESDLTGWTSAGTTSAITSGCHGGTGCAQVGATTATNGDSSVSQTFTAPTGATSVSFWYKETCPDTDTYDWATATLADNTAGTTATVVAKACIANGAWTNATSPVTAGHSYTLTLTSHDDNYASDPTYTIYDDVTVVTGTPPNFSLFASPTSVSTAQGASGTSTITVTGTNGFGGSVALSASGVPSGATATFNPTSIGSNASSTLTLASGTAAAGSYTVTVTGTSGSLTHTTTVAWTITAVTGGGITNGGFESGTTGWTTSGASTSIVTTGCHSGTSCARAGSTAATNGDSTFTQTFTVPAGKSQLSIWYKSTCPDSVTYDWVTITLNGTTSVLAKTCSTNASWVNITKAVTAGTTYTLALTSHDDNYASDPTYTLFDDVTLN